MPYKDLEKRKKFHREYMIKWKEKNKDKWKKIQKKSESRLERKEYLKKWQKENPKSKEIKKRFFINHPNIHREYDKKYRMNNLDRVKSKQDKYYKTDKGILNQIKKVQNRRSKFKEITKTYNQRPTKEVITFVNLRDKVCVYCGKEFSLDKTNKKDYRSYDHLNAFKPHSLTNTVKCCGKCNSSKADRDVIEWLKSKGYKPSKIVYELTSSNLS
ncbi:MAG TPA: hypothetical protein VJ438_06065 [Candidatus Nanoarchaeia archaeon]|nr:hypothetical protein [Candidatus Nanoarchaeia archaeon]